MKTSSVPLTAGRRDGPVTGLGTHIPQEFLPKADPERPAPPSEPSLGPVGISGIRENDKNRATSLPATDPNGLEEVPLPSQIAWRT